MVADPQARMRLSRQKPDPMPVTALFPTRLYVARLPAAAATSLNARLLKECLQLRLDDAAGQHWSKHSYPGGFTSYGSAHRMHLYSPTFAELQRRIDRHVKAYARALDFDLEDALKRLIADGLVTEAPDGRLVTLPPRDAALHIDRQWDQFLDQIAGDEHLEGHEMQADAGLDGLAHRTVANSPA